MVSLIHLRRREKVTDYFWLFEDPSSLRFAAASEDENEAVPWMIDSVFHHIYCAARRQTPPPCLQIQKSFIAQ
jgi:hypothetical protein